MAKKITIQHWYTTGSTTAPNDLVNGEIAISHTPENEAIFIKPRQEAGKPLEEIKFIPEVRIRKMFEEAGIGSNDVITGLSKQLSDHIEVTGAVSRLGHVSLVEGDVEDITGYTIGEAAASYHTHGQYLEKKSLDTTKGFQKTQGLSGNPDSYGVKAGTGITVDSNGVSIREEYQGKIASGVTAYGWGDHKNEGYAKNDDLTAHTTNGNIHVTKKQKDTWDDAANVVSSSAETWNETITKVNTSATTWNVAAERINSFMDSEQIEGAVDTLKEIQQFLDGTGSTVQTLLDNLNELTTDVENNTTAITKNINNITSISGDVKTISGRVDTLSTNVENVFINFVQSVTSTGSNIKAEKKGTTEKSYEISHTGPASATTKFEGTTTTGLAFGDSFKVVSNLGYDANGHVVTSATTASTFTLPELPTATTSQLGVSKLKEGDLSTITSAVESEAAASYHFHSQYVKFTDLEEFGGTTPLVISCGTY